MTQMGKARDASMYKANKLFMDDLPIVPLFYPVDDFVVRPYVKGLERTTMGTFYMGNVVIGNR